MEVGLGEAETKLSALLARVEQGEEVTITRHGKPVARLVPMPDEPDARVAREAAIEWIRAFRETHPTGGEDTKDWIDEGRE